MTEDERAQLVAAGLDPTKLDPQHPNYDPTYGDDSEVPSRQSQWGRMNDRGKSPGAEGHIKYKVEYAQIAKVMCKNGATNAEVCEALGIWLGTLQRWRTWYPDFREAMDVGRDAANQRIVERLYDRAMGYTIPVEKVFCHNGNVVRADTYEHVLPDTKALMFWATNRLPDDWKHRRETRHEVETTLSPANTIGILELARRLQFLQTRQIDVEKAEPAVIDVTPEEDDKDG